MRNFSPPRRARDGTRAGAAAKFFQRAQEQRTRKRGEERRVLNFSEFFVGREKDGATNVQMYACVRVHCPCLPSPAIFCGSVATEARMFWVFGDVRRKVQGRGK